MIIASKPWRPTGANHRVVKIASDRDVSIVAAGTFALFASFIPAGESLGTVTIGDHGEVDVSDTIARLPYAIGAEAVRAAVDACKVLR